MKLIFTQSEINDVITRALNQAIAPAGSLTHLEVAVIRNLLDMDGIYTSLGEAANIVCREATVIADGYGRDPRKKIKAMAELRNHFPDLSLRATVHLMSPYFESREEQEKEEEKEREQVGV